MTTRVLAAKHVFKVLNVTFYDVLLCSKVRTCTYRLWDVERFDPAVNLQPWNTHHLGFHNIAREDWPHTVWCARENCNRCCVEVGVDVVVGNDDECGGGGGGGVFVVAVSQWQWC